MQQRRHPDGAVVHEMDAVALEPRVVVPRVRVPVDDRDLGMAPSCGEQHLVHADVPLLPLPQVRPENAGRTGAEQRRDRLLDALGEGRRVLVVAHLDEHRPADPRAQLVDDVDEGRHLAALERAAHAGQTAADADLQVHVEAPLQDTERLRVPQHRRQDRVADDGHARRGSRRCRHTGRCHSGQEAGRERHAEHRSHPRQGIAGERRPAAVDQPRRRPARHTSPGRRRGQRGASSGGPYGAPTKLCAFLVAGSR